MLDLGLGLWRKSGAGGGALIVSDSFDRANSAVSLGTADSGQVWSALAGTWGISSNQAYCAVATGGATSDSAVLESGVSDCTVAVTIATLVDRSRLIFRAVDNNNQWQVQALGAVWQVYSVTAGAAALEGDNLGSQPMSGDRVSVRLDGTTIEVSVNGAVIDTIASAIHQTATKHGIGQYNSTVSRFNNFTVVG